MASTTRPGAVLITGASTGIGRETAIHLARAGWQVLAGVRCDEDAASLEQLGRGTPAGIRPLHLDVTRAESVAASIEQARSLLGSDGLRGLVNNAGICVVGPAECVELSEWRRQFEVNFFGAIAMTQAAMPLLRAHVAQSGRGSARIINMSSITGIISTPLFGAYSSSKAALQSFSDALRLELRGQGIGVSVIVPGTIRSEIWRKEKACVDAFAEGSAERRLYGTLIDQVAGYVFAVADKAKPAVLVAKAVERCLSRRLPPNRLLVAWEAQVGARAKTVLPGRLLDFLMCKTLGVPRD